VMSVCLSVSLSVCLSVREHIFTRSLPIFVLAVIAMAVARSLSDRVTKCQLEAAFWGFSFPLTMHCKAFAAKGIMPYRPGRDDGSATALAKCDIRLPCYGRHM